MAKRASRVVVSKEVGAKVDAEKAAQGEIRNHRDTDVPAISLLKFGATWCGPCHAMKPVLEKFRKAHPEIPISEHDIGKKESFDLVDKYTIQSIPRVLFVDDKGNPLASIEGAVPIAALEESFKKAKKKLSKLAEQASK